MRIRRLSYPVRYGYGMPSLLGLDDHLHMSLTTSALSSLTSLVNGLLSSLRLAKRSALAVSTLESRRPKDHHALKKTWSSHVVLQVPHLLTCMSFLGSQPPGNFLMRPGGSIPQSPHEDQQGRSG